MSDEPIQLPVDPVRLPSGGWATFRTTVKYGYRKKLRELAYRIASKTTMRGEDLKRAQAEGQMADDAEVTVDIDAGNLAELTTAQEYFPLVYMLTGWSYPMNLPTIADLSPLDEIELEDGEFLFEKAKELVAASQLDATPTEDGDPDSPTAPSSESVGLSSRAQ